MRVYLLAALGWAAVWTPPVLAQLAETSVGVAVGPAVDEAAPTPETNGPAAQADNGAAVMLPGPREPASNATPVEATISPPAPPPVRVPGTPQEIAALRADADRLFADKSYALALEKYQALNALQLPPAEQAYVEFRVADSQWRNAASSQQADQAVFTASRSVLEKMANALAEAAGPERAPRLWAEIEESLGDSWWMNPQARNWSPAWRYYQAVLEWWAGSTNLTEARKHYLDVVFKAAQPDAYRPQPWGPPFGMYANQLPLAVLLNAVKIAEAPAARAEAQYLLAQALANTGRAENALQVAPMFEASLAVGRDTPWYDDALMGYASWMENSGNLTFDEQGQLQRHPDYVRALELFRRLLTEIPAGDSRFRNEATAGVRRLTEPELTVGTSGTFLPGSLEEIYLSWRNLENVKVNIYPVDLARDVKFPAFREQPNNRPQPLIVRSNPAPQRVEVDPSEWWYAVDLGGKTPLRVLTPSVKPASLYAPAQEKLWLEPGLPAGAYVVEATGNGTTVRAGLVVSDQAVVLKWGPGHAAGYLAQVESGAPLPDATVTAWFGVMENNTGKTPNQPVRRWEQRTVKADKDGLLQFDLPRVDGGVLVFLAAAAPGAGGAPGRPAWVVLNDWNGRPDLNRDWRIYVFSDRPAYRPGEKASWKIIARVRHETEDYSVPADTRVLYEIDGPRGDKVASGAATLDAYGTAAGEFELPADAPLGSYTLNLIASSPRENYGGAEVFRVEEYKLPEFKVAVSTGQTANGQSPQFRLGQSIPIEVKAEYYFGGPVPNADVQLEINKRPFHPWWGPRPLYPWMSETPPWPYRGPGQVVARPKLKTGADGFARYQLETPNINEGDLEYTIIAKVTDSSRREIIGEANVRVTRQSFFAYLTPHDHVVRPGGSLDVRLRTLNANNAPVAVAGKATITRRESVEIFVAKDGRDYTAAQLRAQGGGGLLGIFSSAAPAVTFKERQEKVETIATVDVQTDKNGDGVVRQVAAQPGLYEVRFASADAPAPPVTATASVYVADQNTTDINVGGDLHLIVNQDTVKVGENAEVVLTLPHSGGTALFTVEAGALLETRLLKFDGDAKFLSLPVTDAWVPNVQLGAVSVRNLNLSSTTEAVQVPPTKNFLEVATEFSQPRYLPRGEGLVKVSIKDDKGAPAANAAVALAVVDDSIFYIQPEIAGDPRQFFYGEKRWSPVQLASSFQLGPYRKITKRSEPGAPDSQTDKNGDLAVAETANFGRMAKAGGGMLAASAAMPMTARSANFAMDSSAAAASTLDSGDAAPPPNVVVRSDFRSSILWLPDLITGADGTATAPITFPDNTTAWRATARAVSLPSKFGWGNATAQTQMPLIARLEAPRFFITGDRPMLSGVFNNNTDHALTVQPTLTATGLDLVAPLAPGSTPDFSLPAGPLSLNAAAAPVVTVPAGGEGRADWLANIVSPGEAKLTLKGVSGNLGDAMEKTYPVYEHGMDKTSVISGKIPAGSGEILLDLPPRKTDGQTFTIQVSSSLAVSLLDALPYLVSYPYGCTEQTMSRFLPAVIVSKSLRDLGADPADLTRHIFGGIEPATAAKTNPPLPPSTDPNDKAASLAQLQDVTAQSLARLYDFQHASGAWGWWKEGEDDLYMTGYVVWGLSLAQSAGVDVDAGVLASARAYLDTHLVDAEMQPDLQAWLLHALAARFVGANASDVRPSRAEARAVDNLYKQRDQLNAYTRALLAIASRRLGFPDESRTLGQNLRNGIKLDANPRASVLVSQSGAAGQPFATPTAHWGEDGLFYRWSDGGIEATAFGLMALLATDPQSDLVGPVAQWLVQNRRGAQWSNTRDSAIAVLALTQYLKDSGELRDALQADILVNGVAAGQVDVAAGAAAAARAPTTFSVKPELLRDGANTITLRRTGGAAPLYFSIQANYFTLENPIAASGHELFVRRQYFRVRPAPTLLGGYREILEPLADGATLQVGDQIEVAVYAEGKNNLEYLMFEDLKPAGCEATALRSGAPLYAREVRPAKLDVLLSGRATPGAGGDDGDIIPYAALWPRPGGGGTDPDSPYTGRQRWVYEELRDRQVTTFADRLPEGLWEIRYRLRAEIPGFFHALPVRGSAMYVPEIRANSNELRLTITDPPKN